MTKKLSGNARRIRAPFLVESGPPSGLREQHSQPLSAWRSGAHLSRQRRVSEAEPGTQRPAHTLVPTAHFTALVFLAFIDSRKR